MDSVPQPILYTVIGALCTVIVFLFRLSQTQAAKTLEITQENAKKALELCVSHHEGSTDEWRAERVELRKSVHLLTRAVNGVVLSMFFLPKQFIDEAKKTEEELKIEPK